MTTFRLFAIVVLMVSTQGCGSLLFNADFDSDTLGAVPRASPPGDPVGDSILLSPPPDISSSQVEVISDTDFTGRSLRYRDEGLLYVSFVSKEIRPTSEQYWAAWNGRPNLPIGRFSELDIWIGSEHYTPLASLRFDDGQVRLQTGSGSSPSYETVGRYTSGVVHTVVMNVDKTAATYSIWIFSSGEDLSTGARPVLNAGALETLRPTVHMHFPGSISSAGSYTVDNVVISEACPLDNAGLLTYGSCEDT